MHIRLLFASPDEDSIELLHSIYASAMDLMCLSTSVATVADQTALLARIEARSDDVVLLDWLMAEAATPTLVTRILERNPKMRVVVMLPETYRQYRQKVWDAGACNSIPKEHMEQEWFSSILCVMHRAMEREERLRMEFMLQMSDPQAIDRIQTTPVDASV